MQSGSLGLQTERPVSRSRLPRCTGTRGPHVSLWVVSARVLFSGCLPATSLSLPPAWPREEARGSSSEEDAEVDVEGLRRRRGRGREPRAAQPAGPLHADGQARGEGTAWELGVSLNVCVLGALVMLGLGALVFSGERDLTCWLLCPRLASPSPPSPHQALRVCSQVP